MVRLSKIYTRGGDKGKTSLVGGTRIAKSAPRLDAYGTVDELNSLVGVVRTLAERCPDADVAAESAATLRGIQNDLFDIGSRLATEPGANVPGMPVLDAARVTFLEQRIDAYQTILEPLASFVLPGGGELNAHAHVARTVCRRVERILWTLHETEPVDGIILTYMNRLSDYFFVYSRWASRKLGTPEYLWEIRKPT